MQPDTYAKLLTENLSASRKRVKRISRSSTRHDLIGNEKMEEVDMKLGREDLLLSSSGNNVRELDALNRLKDLSEGEISSNNSFEEKFKDFCLFETLDVAEKKPKNLNKIRMKHSSSLSPTASGPKGTLESNRDCQSPEVCASDPDLAESPKEHFGFDDELVRTFTKRLPTIKGVTKEDSIDSPRKETEGLNTIRQTLATNLKKSANHIKTLQEKLQEHLSKKALSFNYAAKGGGYTNTSAVRILNDISRDHSQGRKSAKREIFKPIVHGRSISLPRIGRSKTNNKSMQYYHFNESPMELNEKATERSVERTGEATKHDDTDANLSRIISPREKRTESPEFSPYTRDGTPSVLKKLEFGSAAALEENKIIYVRQGTSDKRELKLVKGGILAVITQKEEGKQKPARQMKKSFSTPDSDEQKNMKVEGERIKDYKLEWQAPAPKDFTNKLPKFMTKMAMNKLQTQVLGKRALIMKSSKEIRQPQQQQLSQAELKIESSPISSQKEPVTVKRILMSSRDNLIDIQQAKTDLRQAKSQQLLIEKEKRYTQLIKSIENKTLIGLSRDSPDRIKESSAVNASGEFSDLNMADMSPGNVSKSKNELESAVPVIKESNTVHKVQSRFAQRYENIAKLQGRSPAKYPNTTKLEPLLQPILHQAEYRQVGNYQGYLL